jgi:hypothetical protein
MCHGASQTTRKKNLIKHWWSPLTHQTAGYQLDNGFPLLVSPLNVQFEHCLFSLSKDTGGVGAIPSPSKEPVTDQHPQLLTSGLPSRNTSTSTALWDFGGSGTFWTGRCQDLYGDEPPKDQCCRRRLDKRSRPCFVANASSAHEKRRRPTQLQEQFFADAASA